MYCWYPLESTRGDYNRCSKCMMLWKTSENNAKIQSKISFVINTLCKWKCVRNVPENWSPKVSDTNRPVQSQKKVRSL